MVIKNKSLISVIIATYNRCESLKDTLESLLNQECDGRLVYEILVADNNSKDRTKQVVESYKGKFNGKLSYLFESRQGKCYALNRGIKEAKGEIVAFTDDDVIVDKRWLIEIKNTFKNSKIGIVGGLINPIWLSERPHWLSEKFYGMLSIQNYGDGPFIATSDAQLPSGANFAFRKNLFYKYGLFDGKMKFAHDTEICLRFLRKGIQLGYNPQIVVYHKVIPSRLKKKYLYQWFYRRGKLYNYITNHTITEILRGFFDKVSSFIWCSIKGNTEDKIYHKAKICFYLGQLQWMLNKILRHDE